jgi:integrase
VVKRGSVTVKI